MGVVDKPDRWIVEWNNGALSGKHVTVRNPRTGQSATGHHWTEWDPAARDALQHVEAEGDLVSEIEDYLSEK